MKNEARQDSTKMFLFLSEILILINNKKIMGSYTNSRGFNILAWVTVVVLIGLSVTLLFLMVGIV